MSTVERAYDEIIDLFARGSSPADIVRFRPSSESQARASYLLERNRLGTLTGDEAAELDRLGQMEHVMQLVKARARSFESESPTPKENR